MGKRDWKSLGVFAATVWLSGLAAGLLSRHTKPLPTGEVLGGVLLVSVGYVILGKVLARRRVKHWLMTITPLIQASCIGLWACQTDAGPIVAIQLYWLGEWALWAVRLTRVGAVARGSDVYPGLVISVLVLAWIGGQLTSGFFDAAPWLVAWGALLVNALLATTLRLSYEVVGPEALTAYPLRCSVLPEFRLSSWQDGREALVLLAVGVMLSWDANAAMESGWHQPGKAWINGGHPQEAASWWGTWVLGITPLLIGNHPVRITGWLAYVCWGIVGLAWWPESGGSDSGVSLSVVHGLRCCGFLILVARLAALCRPMALTSWLGLAGVAIAGTMYLRWWLGDWLQVPSGVNRCVAIVLAVAVHLYWLREWMELTASPLAWLIYRIHHTGAGRPLIPWHGPLIVIANHAAWFDPFWLGKVIPRRLTPMMTSDFYDLPGLYWLMRYVLRVIRVEEAHARREAPELDEAVARLDAGECLVIFPEGRLRREEHRPLAPFQRGIWLILQKRPATPVVPCWIEGNWGSFFSWKDGPPMKNKPFDWGRHILVVVGEPILVPSEILNDHRTTRRYLEEAVLRLRPTADSQHSPSATLSNRSASPAKPSPSRVEQAPEGNGDDGNGDKVH